MGLWKETCSLFQIINADSVGFNATTPPSVCGSSSCVTAWRTAKTAWTNWTAVNLATRNYYLM